MSGSSKMGVRRGPLYEGIVYATIVDLKSTFAFNKDVGYYQYLKDDNSTFIEGSVVPYKVFKFRNFIVELGSHEPVETKANKLSDITKTVLEKLKGVTNVKSIYRYRDDGPRP